ncbi:N6-adenosine-specific RNA methylase IME4 [Bradyrhizobium erythrophlei]|jgi:N6-adenosine-specific RNA methylase IME4|nr:N6-adenosine-specific RNA methylase IME4 [Bradyrhizobium erythrophlei]
MFVGNTSVPAGAQDLPAPETAVWPFAPLAARSYDALVIDPPWHFNTWSLAGQTSKSASGQYRTMPLAEIMALPVRELLKPDAIVYLWATGAMLPHALATLRAWGIVYKTSFVWRKVTRNGKVRWGTGRWAQSGHELVLLGVVGRPRCFLLPSIFDGIAREHSRKPDEFYGIIAKKTPGLRRADVFAREKREGWDCWGDEVGKFSPPLCSTERSSILIPSHEQTGVQP